MPALRKPEPAFMRLADLLDTFEPLRAMVECAGRASTYEHYSANDRAVLWQCQMITDRLCEMQTQLESIRDDLLREARAR